MLMMMIGLKEAEQVKQQQRPVMIKVAIKIKIETKK